MTRGVIVVGVDESDRSISAATTTCRIAGALDCDVHAVFVTHVPATMLAVLAGVPSAASDFADAQREAVWGRIGPILEAAGVGTERVDLEGYPPDTLVAYAEQVEARMLVVGSRGRGDLASLLLGSTSHRVLNHAHCDVLVVR